MVTRIWTGRTKVEDSSIYTKIIEERDLPNYKKTNGFIKHTFLIHTDDEFTYFKLLTFWTDFEAITNLTGPKINEAKFYAEDEKYVIDFPGQVSHYHVFSE